MLSKRIKLKTLIFRTGNALSLMVVGTKQFVWLRNVQMSVVAISVATERRGLGGNGTPTQNEKGVVKEYKTRIKGAWQWGLLCRKKTGY